MLLGECKRVFEPWVIKDYSQHTRASLQRALYIQVVLYMWRKTQTVKMDSNKKVHFKEKIFQSINVWCQRVQKSYKWKSSNLGFFFKILGAFVFLDGESNPGQSDSTIAGDRHFNCNSIWLIDVLFCISFLFMVFLNPLAPIFMDWKVFCFICDYFSIYGGFSQFEWRIFSL